MSRRINKRNNKLTRICTICKVEHPKTKEYFTTFISERDGEVWMSRCKSCDKLHIQKRNSDPVRYIKSLINGITKDVYRKRKGFDIDFDYIYNLFIEQKGLCKITGLKMTSFKGKGLYFSNISIDKIDPNLGYVKDNVQLICLWANQSKGSLSLNEFKNMINKTYNHLYER